jgi:hypothetical protein
MTSIHAVIGIAAGVLAFTAAPIYWLDILRGHTKPSRITWWLLSILNAVIVASSYVSGARDTLWIPAAYSLMFFITGILSIKYGEGGWSGLDRFCLAGAVLALGLWWLLQSPQLTLIITILVDFFALVPTLVKSYKEPDTEGKTAWIVAASASALNIFAIEAWIWTIYLYPVYVFVTNSLIVLFLLRPVLHDPDLPRI